MSKSTTPTADDGTFMTIACLVMKLNCNPTWEEVHQAEKIMKEKGGEAAAEFLKHCVPSPARDFDNAERERDRKRD